MSIFIETDYCISLHFSKYKCFLLKHFDKNSFSIDSVLVKQAILWQFIAPIEKVSCLFHLYFVPIHIEKFRTSLPNSYKQLQVFCWLSASYRLQQYKNGFGFLPTSNCLQLTMLAHQNITILNISICPKIRCVNGYFCKSAHL